MKKINIIKKLVMLINVLLSFTVSAQDFNILKYGAVSDTAKLSTKAINQAISACNQSGGGRVVIPAGSYKSGTIMLKNNVELYLENGAILYASTNHQDFPRLKEPQYTTLHSKGGWYALIYAENASHIAIKGLGTIDGQGAKQMPRPQSLGGDLDGRPRNILLISCKNVTVEGISLLNSGIWNQHYLNCEDVLVTQIKVFNHSNRNNDGIDIDGCRRFILSNSIIDSDDDGICLKSTGPAPCENILITGCIASSHTNAIKCGTESTGGFKNIVIANCIVKPSGNTGETVFRSPQGGYTGVSLEIVDGGIMDGVTVNNVMIQGTECPIYVRLGNRARKYTENAPPPPIGKMKNIQISNITAINTGNYSSSITGVPGAFIENINLTNIHLTNIGALKDGEYIKDALLVKEAVTGYPQPNVWGNLPSSGLFIRHVKNIGLENISLRSEKDDPRVPVIAVDVHHLSINNLKVNDGLNEKGNVQLIDVPQYLFDTTVKAIASVQEKPDPDFNLYILIGQSNMAGRAIITEEFKDQGRPNLYMLNQQNLWVTAKNPLHFDKPKAAGVGPGMMFGIEMAEAAPKKKIGLIPCAVGGTAIESWVPGGYDKATDTHPYDDAIIRIKEAMKSGVIKGVLWHQGEANSSLEKSKIYLGQLTELIERVRKLTGNPKLPVVVGELGRYRESYQYINQELTKLPGIVKFTAVASSEGLVDKGDQTHFDGPSANEMGKRMAVKMIGLQKKNK